MSDCLLCSSPTKDLANGLQGFSSRGDKLFEFDLIQCSLCHLIQKRITDSYLAHVNEIYANNYELPGGGRNVNVELDVVSSREEKLVESLVELGIITKKGKMLDIGTGAGYMISAFSKYLESWEFVGFDLSPTKENLVKSNGAHRFYHGSLESIDEQFDLILMNHVLEHVTDPLRILIEVKTLLKPNGVLVVIVPCYAITNTDFYFIEHCSHFSPENLTLAALFAGFEITTSLSGRLGTVEIGFAARISKKDSSAEAAFEFTKATLECIDYQPESVAIGVFGLNGTGMWLSSVRNERVNFIVDDNPWKQGETFAGIPILALSEVPQDATIIVAYNNLELTRNMMSTIRMYFRNLKCAYVGVLMGFHLLPYFKGPEWVAIQLIVRNICH